MSKRPLNAQKRTEVGKKLLHDCASNWVRDEVATLQFGDKIPANIYKKCVLRKCKQQEKDKKIGIELKCPIMSLIEFKHSSYAGSIHNICEVYLRRIKEKRVIQNKNLFKKINIELYFYVIK